MVASKVSPHLSRARLTALHLLAAFKYSDEIECDVRAMLA